MLVKVGPIVRDGRLMEYFFIIIRNDGNGPDVASIELGEARENLFVRLPENLDRFSYINLETSWARIW